MSSYILLYAVGNPVRGLLSKTKAIKLATKMIGSAQRGAGNPQLKYMRGAYARARATQRSLARVRLVQHQQ